MSKPPVLKITGLSYDYARGKTTLSDISMLVEQGSIYGFLGPNGSGKTTTLSLLLGLLPMQNGHVEIFGENMQLNRTSNLKKIGSLVESPSLYGHLTAKENLEVYRQIYGATKARVEEVLKMVGLHDTGKKKTKHFSLGMKQRLAIALALLPKPALLILDEPTNGLDPNGIIEFRQLLRKLNKAFGITIIISSHLLSEVEKMVSHVGIISGGKMLFQGSVRELQQLQNNKSTLLINTSDNDAAYHVLCEYHPERSYQDITVTYTNNQDIAMITKRLTEHKIDVYLLQPKENNLEELYLNLTSN
ncbi:MAG: ATP-binding cassette domain-containing protein [Bacteroidota bacterium]